MKERLENFLYYYKGHIIAALFIVILIVIGFRSCAEKTMPDLKMVYFSTGFVKDESAAALEQDLRDNGFVKDIDADGEAQFYIDRITHDFDVNGTADEATINKIQTMIYAGDHTLVLAHRYALEDYDGCFEDISDKADGFDVFVSPEESFVSGISVEGNTYLESLGINTDNLYVAMRRRTQKQLEKGSDEQQFKVAYEVMDYILSFNGVTD